MTTLRPALLGLAAAIAGCGGVPVTTHAELDPVSHFAAVVLEPIRATAGSDASALGDRLVAVTLQSVNGQALVWSGSEIQILHADRSDWSATTAVPILRSAGVRPEEALVLRARLQTGQASSQQEVRGAGGAAVGAAEELRWRATVEILQPSTGKVLVETSAEAHADPFASNGTDAPAQTGAVLERAAAEALSRLAGRWTPPRPPHGPVIETWEVVGAGDGRLARGLDAELQRLDRLRIANPGLDDIDAARLARLPSGVYVRQSPPGYRLQPEDVVLSIGTAPAHAAALSRARFSTASVSCEVRSPDGRLRRVNFP